MADTDDVSVTRVFVSGLPPAFTSEQLRSHFGQKFPVTDAHIVANRRIGFVGFSDHESAMKASQYYNRSFIRMSKISVDLARPVEFKRDATGQAAPISRRGTREQQHNRYTVEPRAPGSTNKRKRSSKDDGETLRSQTETISDRKNEDLRKDNLEKAVVEGNSGGSQSGNQRRGDLSGDQKNRVDQPVQDDPNSKIEGMEDVDRPESAAKSDSDWLRGKTSRLLDLIEPEEAAATLKDSNTHSAEQRTLDQETLSTPDANDEASVHNDTYTDNMKLKVPNGRLFIRNLPFNILEEELERKFSTFGRIAEIHLVKDSRTSTGKGLGFVQYVEPDDAEKALENLDGKAFQGRLIHILPASDKKEQKLSEFEISKLPLKKQKAIKRKAEASTSSFSWNSLYMNPDAVLASVADRLGVSKSDLLDASSADAAVKQAQAETSVIKETKDYFQSNGINLEAFKNRARDDRTILLKNFPYGTTSEELTTLLNPYGTIQRCIFPPTGTMAIIQFDESYSASQAVKGLAYRNIKGSVLYLEKAPADIFSGQVVSETATGEEHGESIDEELPDDESATAGTTSTIFVRNLNFATSSSRLTEIFKPLSGFLSARVKTRVDAKRPGEILSMGFGFAEFRTKRQADAAVVTMNGHRLDGHEILVQPSHKHLDAAEERRQEDNAKKADSDKTKIIIKNLPFEASKKDVRSLFASYGQLRSVRMPKKFDSSGRGFAFADFLTAKEAKNAVEALSNTHLLGRRLVLDFAEGDAVDPEDVIKAMEKKAGRQVHLTTVNKMMTGSARKKFNVDARDDVDPV